MIAETPALQKQVQPEGRFVTLLKNEFVKHAKEINKLCEKKVDINVGVISAYAGDTIPDGYLRCDGSAVSRNTYEDLFTIIGTTYGNGDGFTTFNVPNIPALVTNVVYIIKV